MRRSPLLRVVLSVLVLAAYNQAAHAQHTNSSHVNFVINGPVNTAVRIGNTLYIGGSFSRIAPSSNGLGSMVAVNPATGQIVTGRVPVIDDTINALLPDGSGGYYVGGFFEKVNGSNQANLIRVNAAGQRITTFNPGAGGVRALALAGGHLWVGGNFTFVAGQFRQRLVAMDPVTGQLRAFNTDANGDVQALAVLNDKLIVAGAFTEIAGQPRARIAWFNSTTGALLPGNSPADGNVNALAVSGNIVYAGGAFANIGGFARARIAAIDETGAVTPWTAPAMTNNINKVVVANGVVYAGGLLTISGATPRSNAAAFDAATGALMAWNPAPAGNVTGLTVSGSVIYIGGNFSFAGGQPRTGIVAVDAVSGALTPWNPGLIRQANAVEIAADGTVVIGGGSNATGGVARDNVAAFDLVSGALLPWNPQAGGISINAMAADGNKIYIGGNFTIINNAFRLRLAVLDANDPAWVGSWNPGANGVVNALLIANGQLYAGGGFTMTGGQSRARLASFALDTGELTSWAPEATGGTNPVVRALEPGDGVIFIGGSFQSVGGQLHPSGAQVDAVTGIPTGFNPGDPDDVPPNPPTVFSAVLSGSNLFVGGDQNIGLLAVDPVTADDTIELPEPNPGSSINAVAVARDTLYVGGSLFTLGGIPKRGLAAVDLTQSPPVVTSWTPQPRTPVNAIRAFADVVVAVGNFANTNPLPATGVAVYERTSGPPAAPQDFSGYAADNNVSLQWIPAPLGPETTGYNLEVGFTAGATDLVMPLGNVTSLNTPAPTGTYYVRVRASNAAGESEPTPEVRLDPGCTAPPGAPLAFNVTESGGIVSFNWLKGSGNVGRYILEAGSASGSSNLAMLTVPAPTTTFSTPAPPGTYYLRVRAANSCGTSDASAEVFVTVGSGATLPGAPGTPAVTVNGSAVALSWAAPSTGDAPTGYVFEAGSAPGLSNLARIMLGPTPGFAAGGVPPGIYYVRVRAVNAAGTGPVSADATVVVP